MVLAVVERDAQVHHRVARELALAQRLDDALLDGRDERPRDRAADDLVDELEAVAALQGLDPDPAVPVLAPPAALLLVLALGLGRAGDGLAVGHVGRGQLHRDAEAPLDALGHHLDVHLGEPADQEVARLLVAVHVEGRVLVGHPAQRRVELVLVGLGARGDREAHERRREPDRREGDRPAGREHVPGRDLLELGDGADVARPDLLQRHVVLALEREELADALLAAGPRAGRVAVARQHARDHAQQVDAAAELVGQRLEAEGDDRPVLREPDRDGLARLGSIACRGAASTGDGSASAMRSSARSMPITGAPAAQTTGKIRPSSTPARIAPISSSVVISSPSRYFSIRASSFSATTSISDSRADLGGVGEVVRDRPGGAVRRAPVVRRRGHRHEVHDAAEAGLAADRDLDRDGAGRHLRQRLHRPVEVGALAVEHVHDDARGSPARPPAPTAARSAPRSPPPRSRPSARR